MAKTSSKANAAQAAKTSTLEAGKPFQTKKEKVLTLLRQEGGTTLDQVVEITGWLPHSTRAVFAGLRKKGFTLERTRADGVTRYAITAEPSA